MHVLAVTGGLGAGKSTAVSLFEQLGATVIDLDDVAKTLLAEVPGVRDRVLEEFGSGILGADGHIDHRALAAVAFATPEASSMLDAIMHPATAAAVAGALDALALQGEPPRNVVLAIPLLAETPVLLDLVDAVLTISSSEDARIERAVARGMDETDAVNRIARQASDSERESIADYVIENDGDLESFRNAIVSFWETEIAPREP